MRFALRGQECAFAIPRGDFEALEEVSGHSCDFWNGSNSLIILVGPRGGLPGDLDVHISVRDVERVYVHERVGEQGLRALESRFGSRVTRLHEDSFKNDVHPLHLQPSYRNLPDGSPRVVLPIPIYGTEALSRVGAVAFGRIHNTDRGEYEKAFLLRESRDEDAHIALLSAQLAEVSPLGQSSYLIKAYGQMSPIDVSWLVVLDGTNLDALVNFWNLRARSSQLGSGPRVVGIPAEALAQPQDLESLFSWTSEGLDVTPDLFVLASLDHLAATTHALETLGYLPAPEPTRIRYSFGSEGDSERDQYYWLAPHGVLGGKLQRGVLTYSGLIDLAPGRNTVRFEPEGFGTAVWGKRLRLDLLSWPLPLPVTAATARRVLDTAFVYEGVVSLVTVATNGAMQFELTVPGTDEALTDFLGERGLTGALSDKGRYAQALLGRLGSVQRLDEISHENALRVLNRLMSSSRLKLVQRLGNMLNQHYPTSSPSAEQVRELIQDQPITLELPALSLHDLTNTQEGSRPAFGRSLEPLIDLDFVLRGRKERCKHCGYEAFYTLADLDERIRCKACQESFLLNVYSGPNESPLRYQLDPLMARVMDQDVLPVLLTLRRLHQGEQAPVADSFWPGLEVTSIKDPERKQDCDILMARDGNITLCECKLTAGGLTMSQAQATLTLAESLGARTVFAGLEGDFSAEICDLAVRAPTLQLFRRADLVSESGLVG